MTHYIIENIFSGVELGAYQAASEAQALDMMAQDAGYADYADLCDSIPVAEGELSITTAE